MYLESGITSFTLADTQNVEMDTTICISKSRIKAFILYFSVGIYFWSLASRNKELKKKKKIDNCGE